MTTLALSVGYCLIPRKYRAECLVECTINGVKMAKVDGSNWEGKSGQRTDAELQMAVNSEWGGYQRRTTVPVMVEKFREASVVEFGDAIQISNAMASCRLSFAGLPDGVARIEVFSSNKELAVAVVKWHLDGYKEYLKWVTDSRYRKSVATIRAKIETVRRRGGEVNPQWENEMSETRRIVEAEALKVSLLKSIQVEQVGKWF